MKTYRLLALAATATLLSQCASSEPTAPSATTGTPAAAAPADTNSKLPASLAMDAPALKDARHALREHIDRHPWIECLSATLLLSLLTLLVHGASLQGSWRWDDGAHLSYAAQYTPWQYFLEPHVAQGHSSANVAPWNLLLYDINLSLFGMAAAGHYAHLLLLVELGAALFYAVLREWVEPLPALIGAVALLLGKPTAHIAAGLMHGHYGTGFVFAMLSILGWTRYLKGGRGYWLGLSALAYLLATTCKEVYVPLASSRVISGGE